MTNTSDSVGKVCVLEGEDWNRGSVPDKLFADGAEGRLGEEGGAELMTVDHVNLSLFDGPAPLVEGEQTIFLPPALRVSITLTYGV